MKNRPTRKNSSKPPLQRHLPQNDAKPDHQPDMDQMGGGERQAEFPAHGPPSAVQPNSVGQRIAGIGQEEQQEGPARRQFQRQPDTLVVGPCRPSTIAATASAIPKAAPIQSMT